MTFHNSSDPRARAASAVGQDYHNSSDPRARAASAANVPDPFESVEDGPGPWFYAYYPGECDWCSEPFDEDDLIRAVSEGYQGKECCGND
jgi:hypothetical protein